VESVSIGNSRNNLRRELMARVPLVGYSEVQQQSSDTRESAKYVQDRTDLGTKMAPTPPSLFVLASDHSFSDPCRLIV